MDHAFLEFLAQDYVRERLEQARRDQLAAQVVAQRRQPPALLGNGLVALAARAKSRGRLSFLRRVAPGTQGP
jgi:hypothetical protein